MITVSEPVGGYVGVDLGCAKASMAEQFLNAANISAAIEHMGGKTMSKAMRTGSRVEADLRQVLFQ